MKGSKFLSDLAQIPAASDEDLKRSLLTADGRGREFKTAVLNEILERLKRQHYWDLVYASTTKEQQAEIEKHFFGVEEKCSF